MPQSERLEWWGKANDRRQRLIVQKHRGDGITRHEERELEILQDLAEKVIENSDLFQPE